MPPMPPMPTNTTECLFTIEVRGAFDGVSGISDRLVSPDWSVTYVRLLTYRRRMRRHIRQPETSALEQHRSAHNGRNGIGHTVAEIQLRRMACRPAEPVECPGGRVRHLAAERNDRAVPESTRCYNQRDARLIEQQARVSTKVGAPCRRAPNDAVRFIDGATRSDRAVAYHESGAKGLRGVARCSEIRVVPRIQAPLPLTECESALSASASSLSRITAPKRVPNSS